MNPFEPRKLGKTDVAVTALGLGGTGVAGMYKAVSEKDAIGTVERAWDAGVRYFDVAPFYGFGRGEIIYGRVLKHRPRDEFVLSTKVGRIVHHGKRPPGNRDPAIFPAETETYSEFDFRPEGVTRSFEDSLQRLGLKRIDVLYIHDPDLASSAREVMELTYPVLHQWRASGAVRAIGIGMNTVPMLVELVREGDFDCVLLAGRYTLLDQSALAELLPLCQRRNVSVVMGGAYNSGILATGAVPGAHYDYQPASPAIMEKTRRIEAVCARHCLPLKAAALQFPFGHPAVVSNIPGTSSASRFDENLRALQTPIPASFWEDLKEEELLRDDAPVPTLAADQGGGA